MIIVDASAVLALAAAEPGASRVAAALPGAILGSANLAEVLAKASDRGLDPAAQRRLLDAAGFVIEPVTALDARRSAEIRALDAAHGRPVLSLGDRLCLALAIRMDAPVVTADRAWLDVEIDVEVTLIR